jgi:peroxiredoxin
LKINLQVFVVKLTIIHGGLAMKLRIGERAPDFSLPSHLGGEVQLGQLCDKNVVLAFFPQAWTPI